MALSTDIEEHELLLRLRNSDRKAFDQLYHIHSKALLWKLRRMVKDPQEADELLQDLFVKVWEKREILLINQSFEAYLYRIAQRMAVDYFRSLQRRAAMHQTLQHQLTEIVDTTQEGLDAHQTKRLLDDAIAQLPDQRRKAFMLCKIEGKSHAEAASIMNISPNTVHNHLVKAVASVREYLEKSGKTVAPLALFVAINYELLPTILEHTK